MKPHIYSQLLSELTQTARVYKDTQQLRAQLGEVLSKYIEVEHNTGLYNKLSETRSAGLA